MPNIEEYLHLVIPIIVWSYECQDLSIALWKKAIQTTDGLSTFDALYVFIYLCR
jgi:FKBP12-rapamycin complex-associated protein